MKNLTEEEKVYLNKIKDSLTGEENEIDVAIAADVWHLSRRETIDFFRKLESFKHGRLIIGRRGGNTRFVFEHAADETGLGQTVQVQRLGGTPETPELIDYPFFIRPNLRVTFQLPSDLSAPEAERIAAFVKTLTVGS